MSGEKILDIDDSPTVQRLIEMILSSQGYQVVLASDGEEGIAKAKTEKPALVLVDFVMPKMNGYQVRKTLKEDPEFKNTPIILVTAKGDKVGSKFVDVLGITEYFTKPFQPEELLAKIREVLDKGARRGPAATPAASPPRSEATPARGIPRTPPAPETSYARSDATPARGIPRTAPTASSPRTEKTPARGIPRQPLMSEQTAPPDLDAMVRDVVERVVEELRRTVLPDLVRRELARSRPVGEEKVEAGIRGDLSSFRIVEVMQMLGLQRQTGRLAVTGGGGELEIYFKDGSVALATANSNGAPAEALNLLLLKSCRIDDGSVQHALRVAETTGDAIDTVLAKERILDPKSFSDCLKRSTESTVYRAMALKEGRFVFEKCSPPAFANPLALKVDDLLLEGARRADEWTLIQQKIPSFDLVFETLIGNAEELTTRGLGEIDTSVFALVDGQRTVQNIIDELGLNDFEVAKSLFILLSVNLIRRKK